MSDWIPALALATVAAIGFAIAVSLSTLVPSNDGWIVAAGLSALLILAVLVLSNHPLL